LIDGISTLALLHRLIPGQAIDKSMKESRMMDGTLRQNHPESWVNGAPQYVFGFKIPIA
jgi:hypothetical protein